jgi:L-fuculokinase
MKEDVIAVLDVGKTNKKVLIYNKQLEILAKETNTIGEIKDDKGLKLEQPEVVFEWFIFILKKFSDKYNIKAISVATHGAMGVCIDDYGRLTCPPLAYTNEPGQEFCDSFYAKYGDRADLQLKTATAEIGQMINFGKMLYYFKIHYADKLEKTKYILHYPQYFGYKLTGNAVADTTMLGCHTYLYDHMNKTYSDVAKKLGILDKLPKEIYNSCKSIGTVTAQIAEQASIPSDCIVTAGVHDSNSSLIPFLITEREDFVLNSTGTWCVAMRPSDSISFKANEIGKTVFYNQDIFGNPVKTSIFMGGLEYEIYTKLYKGIHNKTDLPDLDIKLYRSLLDKGECFILPSVIKGAGLFPNANPTLIEKITRIPLDDFISGKAKPEFTKNYKLAMAVLITSLAVQTELSLSSTGYRDGGNIFVEGGFRFNEPYLKLLTAFYPKSNIYRTNINEATALGATIIALSALENKDPHKLNVDLDIDKQLVEKVIGIKTESYKKKFLELIES